MITNSLDVAVAGHRAGGGPDGELVIDARGVRKAYGANQALDGVDLAVRRGELLALLGPNGAGKTTLVEILEGHRRADAGDVRVLGHDPARRERAFLARIGIVLQEGGIDPAIQVREAVSLYGAAYPSPLPADDVLELVGLADCATARAETLSGGQRRRLDLALGIVGDPDLIFLDEPTTGFDPAARRQSWEMISGLRSLGKTILLTTHYMDEARALADHVVVVAHGRNVADGPPESLGGDGVQAAVVSFTPPPGISPDALPLPAGVELGHAGARSLLFRTEHPTRDLAPLLAWAAERQVELEGLSVVRPSLEDVYLQLTEEPA
jgi:ABC-2 type transport system ATP-binding protein